MSRIANKPVTIPSGVKVQIADAKIQVIGAKTQLEQTIHPKVEVQQDGNVLKFSPKGNDRQADAIAGTMRVIVANMVTGVSQGFEKKLKLVGVGYRAQAQGSNLALTLGFSHPVSYTAPKGITFDTPTQTDITVRGADKQLVGQVASEIRRFRPPEPYKGKGVRYTDENVRLKEVKKK